MPERRTSGGLIIPARVVKAHAAYECRVCHAQFGPDELERFTRHCVNCAKRHEGELEGGGLEQRVAMFNPDNLDSEYEDYVRRTGVDRITEAVRRRR